jgi:hypothetical protein
MSDHYTSLVEKIEKQNAYQLRDKLEAHYQLRDAAAQLSSDQHKHEKLLKLIIALQIADVGYSHGGSLASFIKILF